MISCEKENRYHVLLSEMLANTTISEIQNEIVGQDDNIIPTDPDHDAIRHLTFEDVEVAFVKRSNEREKFFKDSIIVVAKNETVRAREQQYSVMRYWQNTFSNWVESEHLFDLSNGPYDDVFIFDKYAIVVDSNKQLVSAVYFDQYRGDVVPP